MQVILGPRVIDINTNRNNSVSVVSQKEKTVDLTGKTNTVNLSVTTHPGGEGTRDYELLYNKPQINGIELVKNKTFESLGLNEITNTELNEMFKDL